MPVSSVTWPLAQLEPAAAGDVAVHAVVARISFGVMNSTVAPRASPMASPR
jgi:hypothetical protein